MPTAILPLPLSLDTLDPDSMTVGKALGDVQMTPPVVAPVLSMKPLPITNEPSELMPVAWALNAYGISNEAAPVDVFHLTA